MTRRARDHVAGGYELVAAFLATLAGGLSTKAAADESLAAAPRPAVHVEVANELLTLQSSSVPLGQVLRAIGEAGGFLVVLRGELPSPIDASFVERPLEKAMQELIGNRSMLAIRDDAAGLVEIKVLGDSPRSHDHAHRQEAKAKVDGDPVDHSAHVARSDWDGSAVGDHVSLTRDEIVRQLDDLEPEVRMAALPKTRWLPSQEAVKMLAGVYADESEPRMRSRVIAALTRIQSSRSTTLLRKWAEEDQDPDVRAQALHALAATAGDRAIFTAVRTLRTESDLGMRRTALEVLARVGGDRAQRHVAQLADDLDDPLHAEAAEALVNWRDDE